MREMAFNVCQRDVSQLSMLDSVHDTSWVGWPWPRHPMCIFYFELMIRDPLEEVVALQGGDGVSHI